MRTNFTVFLFLFSIASYGQLGLCIDPDQIDEGVFCTEVYDPVCGCDDVTYQNECYALNYGGVTSWTSGECAQGVDPCTDVSEVDFGLCDMAMGIAVVNGECVGISGCGFVVGGVDYSAAFYSDIGECEACLEDDCIDPDLIDPDMGCFTVYDPVCGCDSVTYTNACYAKFYNGVTSWTEGECLSAGCPELPPGLNFGMCAAVIGTALIDGTCVGVSGCSTVATNNVDYAEYFYDNFEDCIACAESVDCIDSAQIDSTIFCTSEIDLVCGCDGITYVNDCHAYYYGGVTSWSAGSCDDLDECPELNPQLDFGPCDAIIGTALINGSCVSISGCSTVAGNGVDYAAYFYETSEDCMACADSSSCINPDQIDPEFSCTEEYDPVCGCDSVTYSNDCHAYYYGGVTSWTDGECVFTGIEELEQLVDVKIIQGRYLQLNSDEWIKEVALFDLAGKTVWQEGKLAPGEHQLLIPAEHTGIYLYRIQLNDRVESGKVLIH